eukprot:1176483-Prorocentrum_minimum.AAC.2
MLCYPTQVASLDGRVKLIGAEGVESMLICEPRGSTKLLEFVVDRDILLRVSETGSLEAWSVDTARLIGKYPSKQDPVTAVACIPQTPFVIVGCESGAVHVINLRASAQSSTSLKLTDYELDPDEVFGTDGGQGTPVISLLVQYAWGDPVATRVLIGFAGGSIAFWDIYKRRLVALLAASDSGSWSSSLTAMCWVDASYQAFAAGYEDGTIWLYRLPDLPPSQAVDPSTFQHRLISVIGRVDRSCSDQTDSAQSDELNTEGGDTDTVNLPIKSLHFSRGFNELGGIFVVEDTVDIKEPKPCMVRCTTTAANTLSLCKGTHSSEIMPRHRAPPISRPFCE